MKFLPFFERICEALNINSQSELGRALGISGSSVSSAKQRDSVPPRWILKLSQDYQLNSDWLMTGMGDRYYDRNITFESVPLVSTTVSAGGGSFEVLEGEREQVPFRLDWLKKKGVPGKMVMFEVFGDSMEPLINQGDLVLVDSSNREVVDGKIYAVAVDDAVVLKRVERESDRITLFSENADYPPEILTKDRADSVRIVGKMIWASRDYS